MGRLFGTDGVRGVANKDLSTQLAMEIGTAAAMILKRERGGKKPLVLLGRDTRLSGGMLEHAMAAGLCAAGADVQLLGVVPTPAVAYLVDALGADAGVMLTASHNPFAYNGIKIFNSKGFKLSDEDENEIEAIILDHAEELEFAGPEEVGSITEDKFQVGLYTKHIRGTFAGRLDGKKIVVDCANGSATRTAAAIFTGWGAEVTLLNASPDGVNINDNCGSMHVERLAEYVTANRYDLGLAFDGDADRCLAVDETGAVVDGDEMLCIFAGRLKAQGKLTGGTMVGTVMSNLGFFRFGEDNGISACATKVGDRYVLEKMLAEGYAIGGEQSGHVIFLEHMTTGDGQLSGLQLLAASLEAPVSQLKSRMTRYPQVMVNVECTPQQKENLSGSDAVWGKVRAFEEQLGREGRVLIRPSGTEPLIRVMVEGADRAEIGAIANALADTIREAL